MDLSKFTAFKYQHPGRGFISRTRRWSIALALVAALVCAFAFFPVGILAFLLPLLIFLTAPKQLLIGSRYLICGGNIMYFGNVVRVGLDQGSGRLQLVNADGASLVLEREKFVTNARKAAKIAANKADKFSKASSLIVKKVKQASPDADFSGAPATSAGNKPAKNR